VITTRSTIARCSRAGAASLIAAALMGNATHPAWSAPRQRPDGPGTGTGILAAMKGRDLRTLDGKPLAWAPAGSEVLVINFWASWCRPCRKELPALNELHRRNTGSGVRVIAVSIDLDAENARRFARGHGLTLPIVHDGPDGLARTLDLPHVPYTVVLDRDGALALASDGADAHAVEQIGAVARRLVAASRVPPQAVEGVADERR
jgi:thiol-disulfide isomerase/thioredoxin